MIGQLALLTIFYYAVFGGVLYLGLRFMPQLRAVFGW